MMGDFTLLGGIMNNWWLRVLGAALIAALLTGCGDDDGSAPPPATATAAATLTATPQSTSTPPPTATAVPTDTARPTATATAPPTASPTATATASDTPTPTATETPSLVDELVASGLGRYLGDSTPSETVPNGAWESLRFDPSEEKAICLRGTPYRVEIHRGNSDKVLLYLEGGGACWNDTNCWQIPLVKLNADPLFGGGIFEFDNPDNPFKDWNIVYAPYCDGSVFSGDNLVEYDGKPTYHHGLQNLSAAVTAMRAAFPDPEAIAVAGSSAGGYGTFVGYSVTRVAYPDAPIVVLNDAGPGLQNPDDTVNIADRIANWNFTQFVPPTCTRCSDQLTYLSEWALERDPTLRVGYFSSLRDFVIRSFNNLTPEAYEALLVDVTSDLRSRQPERFQRFFIQGEAHTALALPLLYTAEVGGISLRDWTADLLADGASWQDRVEGYADLSEELSGGAGPFIGAALPAHWAEAGYVEHEYVAAGTASSYMPAAPLTGDGRWRFAVDGSAPYRTRVLVRRPADPLQFSGTVVVEWLNVSGGLDANPVYVNLEEEILRQGHAWVGVSSQIVGVQGGPVLVQVPGGPTEAIGLRGTDPARYATLEHPGDGFSFDVFTQVGRALGAGAGLGGAVPEHLLAAGESQSAIALVTYLNGVQPLARVFDGFFVLSRAAFGLPLVAPGKHADLAQALGTMPVRFRTDLTVPVFTLQSESDVTGILTSVAVRQPDSDRLRLWEVAGTAHADAHLLGPAAAALDCGTPINDGPLHVVAKAALRHLDDWVRSGATPPEAARFELTPANQIRRDADGIALGGVRTPPVDVPVKVLSGSPGPTLDLICLLLGSTNAMSADRIAELYSSRADYEQRYDAAADAAIAAGSVLAEDRAALRAFADPTLVQP